MDTLLTGLETTFAAILRCGMQATVLIPVVLAIHWLFGKRLSASGRRYLWWIVAGRLLLACAKSRITIPLIGALAVVCWTNAATPEAGRTRESSPMNMGGVMAMLPSGDDLGAGWSNRVTSLVDRGSPGVDYFHSGVPEPARELIRSHVPEGGAIGNVSYYRGSNFVLGAWLRRAESTNMVESQWHHLRSVPLVPRLSDGTVAKRSFRRVGNLEAIFYEDESRGSRTLWIASGRWILYLNIYRKMTLDEIFSLGDIFARRLEAGQLAPARTMEGRGPAEESNIRTTE
jgi:hypothetical protein